MIKAFRSLRRKSSRRAQNNYVPEAPKQEEHSLLQLNHIHEEEHDHGMQEVQEVQQVQQEQQGEMCPGLSELLQVQPGSDADTSAVGACCSVCSNSSSEQINPKQSSVCLVQISVSQKFPEPPEDLDLQQHLLNIQNTVLDELIKMDPVLDEPVMGHLIECYHTQTFKQLTRLLQNISSSQNHFVLMKWVLKTYLSQELLGNAALQKVDPIKNIDLLLWTDWEASARKKLLKSVENEVRESLEKILNNETMHEQCDSEEDYVRVYVDTIQCIKAVHKAAQQISPKLADHVQDTCLQELLRFVKRYEAEQTEGLRRKATVAKPKAIHFLKTLKTCSELKKHVQDEAARASSTGEIVQTLANVEGFTLKLLLDSVANMAETHLNKYFQSKRESFSLLPAVQEHFPKPSGADEQKRVVDAAYKLIVQIYVKHLVKSNKTKMEKCWSPDVSDTVREDAAGLHSTMSELAPGVQQHSVVLLKVKELSDCECIEALKVTAAGVQEDFLQRSMDPALLPALLKWKGLPICTVREVLQTIQQDHHPQLRASSGCSCW